MELEINFQNLSQEGSQQTLLRNACLREHFIKNQSCCKECNKFVNEQPCDNPHNITKELHLSEYFPQHTHYQNVHSPNFDNDLHDFQNHISFQCLMFTVNQRILKRSLVFCLMIFM